MDLVIVVVFVKEIFFLVVLGVLSFLVILNVVVVVVVVVVGWVGMFGVLVGGNIVLLVSNLNEEVFMEMCSVWRFCIIRKIVF